MSSLSLLPSLEGRQDEPQVLFLAPLWFSFFLQSTSPWHVEPGSLLSVGKRVRLGLSRMQEVEMETEVEVETEAEMETKVEVGVDSPRQPAGTGAFLFLGLLYHLPLSQPVYFPVCSSAFLVLNIIWKEDSAHGTWEDMSCSSCRGSHRFTPPCPCWSTLQLLVPGSWGCEGSS